MRALCLFCVAVTAFAAPGIAQTADTSVATTTAAVTASTPADRDYAAFKAILAEKAPDQPAKMGAVKYYTWNDEKRLRAQAVGLKFFADYPADVRRWDVVTSLLNAPPLFPKSWAPDADERGAAAAMIDEVARAAWDAKAEGLRTALLAAPDAPLASKETIEWRRFSQDFREAVQAIKDGHSLDRALFRARFNQHVIRYATLDVVATRAGDYLGALERQLPGTARAEWQQLLNAPNAKLRTRAAERVEFFVTLDKPLEIKFTAADGREVDLAKLRGKVVLVDFWATWCGPCIAELPNIKKDYAYYHAKGFEIVGITLENARLLPADTPEQQAAKLAAAKKKMEDFARDNAMPWPQHFDGKYWKNEISTRFGINSIPAMFLLDQEGKVVTTDARGEKLEAEVKRLLKL